MFLCDRYALNAEMAVPPLYVGHTEEIEGIPDSEDRIWELFEGGSQVLAGIESLDIGDDVFCKFRGALWDPSPVLFGYHGTK